MAHRWKFFSRSLVAVLGALAVNTALVSRPERAGAAPVYRGHERPAATTGGSLISLDPEGQPVGPCPLTDTDVAVEISGFIARTRVTQKFENPIEHKIEAVYTFPLPNRAAINEMTLTVGQRVIKGKIKRRAEAQAIYEAARSAGRVTGLLDQERPNIFTQAVANIAPGEQVTVTISYVEILKYADGEYELVFPMVVGPRYIPGRTGRDLTTVSHPVGTPKPPAGWVYDEESVPDAARITPPITPPETRAGHDISVTVLLDSAVALESVQSPTHDIDVRRLSGSRARVTLKDKVTIPNKDFILKYNVAGDGIRDAILTHRRGQSGFFTLILQPPAKAAPRTITPKELVFVLDTSGSMSGFPIEKAKETMRLALAGLHPRDAFNLITFAGSTSILFPRPVRATPENLAKAQAFLQSRRGRGGTEMMTAIRAALAPSDSRNHLRIVCFMTDGYVGNDMAILAEVKQQPKARVFAFGIGSSVNRFLLDGMAELGRGEVEYVGLNDDGSAAAKRFHERVRSPLFTDITIDWGKLEVHDTFPSRIPDLFAARPLVITGRYTQPGSGTVRISGKAAGTAISRRIEVDLRAAEPAHSVLGALWARQQIAHLMSKDFRDIQRGMPAADVENAIVSLGLEHRLLTQFTSFVAVEERTFAAGGKLRRIEVPVELPEGVSYEMLGFGPRATARARAYRHGAAHRLHSPRPAVPPSMAGKFRGPAAEARDMAEAGATSSMNPRMKLSDALKTVLERPLNSSHAAFIKEGKVEVQVWLSDASRRTLTELEQAGLELFHRPPEAKVIIGRIAVPQLEALARLKAVLYVKPVAGS